MNSRQRVIPANILLSGLDLVRRVIQLTYSFVWFNEPFDAIIGGSLLFLGLSGGLLLYQYISDYRGQSSRGNGGLNVPHVELVDSDASAGSTINESESESEKEKEKEKGAAHSLLDNV